MNSLEFFDDDSISLEVVDLRDQGRYKVRIDVPRSGLFDFGISGLEDRFDSGVGFGGIGALDGSDLLGFVDIGEVWNLCRKHVIVLVLKGSTRSSKLLLLFILCCSAFLLLHGLLAKEIIVDIRTTCGRSCLTMEPVIVELAAQFRDLIIRHLDDDVECFGE